MSADGGVKKIFISHASDDPHWPETAVRALATKLRQRGADVLLDYWHEREVVGHSLPLAEWRDWMRQCLDSADHVLCLCTPRYATLARRDIDKEPVGRGVALEAFEIEKRLYKQKQHNKKWCWVLKLDSTDSDEVVPAFMQERCPEYQTPSNENLLVSDLVGKQRSISDFHSPTAPQVTTTETSPLEVDSLGDQCELVIERLRESETFWTALCFDKWSRHRPAALADREGFVQWLAGASDKEATAAMFATQRALKACVDGSPEIGRAAELAAVSVYCLAVCRLVDIKVVGEFYRFPKRVGKDAHLYCAVLATVLCGGRLELESSENSRRPRSPSVYEISVPAAADSGIQVFERAVYVALFPGDPDALEVGLGDERLDDKRRSKIKRHILHIREVDMVTPSLVVHVDAHRVAADDFSRKFDIPAFVCDPDTAEALLGRTVEDLVHDFEEFWSRLRFCNRHTANELSGKPRETAKMQMNHPSPSVAPVINVSFGAHASASVAVTAGNASPATAAPVQVGADPRAEQAWQDLSKQIEELKKLLGDLESKKTRESVSQQIVEAEAVVKSGPGSDNPGRLKGVLEKIKSVGDAADGGEKIVAACGKLLDYLLPFIS